MTKRKCPECGTDVRIGDGQHHEGAILYCPKCEAELAYTIKLVNYVKYCEGERR